ncbi:1,2-phenylacetyl-CoA epoxidase subunit PaaC [Bacillus sp. JJ722]|uniref:1,2-phenylacetyl-CoA epoxidase subunit PaaC n=1 Tax=Bacillus sp. JJ722 TaxID=3122973 RepID=UPI002FFEFBC1
MSQDSVTLSSEYKAALVELLFQLADDDFLYSFRNSEWLGLAPHIEEDVASSSITQDSMGHAAMFYGLLQDLGEGKADDLAHARPAQERKNAIIVERLNGPGYYMENAQYDWAFAVVRNYFYTQAKKLKMDALKLSSYKPLAEVAVKVNMEIYFHLMHWRTWFVQLLSSTEQAKTRMSEAIEQVWNDFGDMYSLGNQETAIKQQGLLDGDDLQDKWIAAITPVFESVGIEVPKELKIQQYNGRNGLHTSEIDDALVTLSEVYNSDPVTAW